MEGTDCTPGPEEIRNIVRYIQQVYREDQAKAVEILSAGWPQMKVGKAYRLLRGEITIEEALHY